VVLEELQQREPSPPLQDTSKPVKGKRGRELRIVIVFFHMKTIVGESSQKLNK
jgi:hypothetical protein